MPAAQVRTIPPIRWAASMFLVAIVFCPGVVRAQSGQEKLIQQRLERNGTLEYEPAGKKFSKTATLGDRQASVRLFGFGGRSANMKTGDGAFHAKAFNDGRGEFPAGSYAVRRATAVDRQALPQADRTFGTRSVDVREDRAANRSMNTRDYVNTNKPFLAQGKRQNNLDEIRDAKNLNVEQIRELLNKNR